MPTSHLPWLARIVLRCLPAVDRDVVVGDFHQSHSVRQSERGRWRAAIGTSLEAVAFVLVFWWSMSVRRAGHAWGAVGEVRIVVRRLARHRASTLASLAVLSSGMAVAAAVFSVLDTVVLSPLPYPQPNELVVVWTGNDTETGLDGNSYANMESWSDASALSATGLFYRPEFTQRTVTDASRPYRVQVGAVDAGFFSTLGVTPALGRTILPEDEVGRSAVVVLSHAYWVRAFGGDPDAIGSTVELDGAESVVVGVMGPELALPIAGTQLWEPHSRWTSYPADTGRRTDDLFGMVGRLREGSSLSTLRAELASLDEELAPLYPAGLDGYRAVAGPLADEIVGPELRQSIWLIVAAGVGLFLAVSANIGQLWATRGLGRMQELAIRRALGASRARLRTTLLLESVVLSLVAALLALLMVGPMLEWIASRVPLSVPRIQEVNLSFSVGAFTLLVGTLTPPVASLLPMLALRSTLVDGLVRTGAQRSIGASWSGSGRSALAVSQLALATLLAVTGSTLVRSLDRASGGDRGVDGRDAWVATIALPTDRYSADDSWTFFRRLVGDVQDLPGVLGTTALSDFVIRRHAAAEVHLRTSDRMPDLTVMADAVLPGYDAALGLSLREGRALTEDDRWGRGNGWPVAVNRTFAQAAWPDESAVGKEFMLGRLREGKPWFRVVGVVEDDRRRGLDQPTLGHMYHVVANPGMDLFVRVEDIGSLAAVTEAVWKIDPAVAAPVFASADDLLEQTIALRRTRTWLVAVAAFSAVGLALLGVFGVLSESVAAKRPEIGLRVALGAARRDVLLTVFREGLVLAGLGLGLGLVAALGVGTALRHLLFEISPWDPLSLTITLGGVAALVCLIMVVPAHRAASIDPVRAIEQKG